MRGVSLRSTRRTLYVVADGGDIVRCHVVGSCRALAKRPRVVRRVTAFALSHADAAPGAPLLHCAVPAATAQFVGDREVLGGYGRCQAAVVPSTVDALALSEFVGERAADGDEVSARALDAIPSPSALVPPVRVDAVVYTGPGSAGDFVALMRDMATVEKTLFIYNDNVSQFLDKQDGYPGGGNAVVRPLRLSGDACGIPTGRLGRGGFASLDEIVGTAFTMTQSSKAPLACSLTARAVIDDAFEEVRHVLRTNTKKVRVIYCGVSEEPGARLGTGIFTVSADVIDYITWQLCQLRSASRVSL